MDNVLIAFSNHHKQHVFASFLRLPAFYKNEKELKVKAIELLKIFDLDGDAETLAKNLAYGQHVVWKLFVPLLQNLKSSSWMSLQQV